MTNIFKAAALLTIGSLLVITCKVVNLEGLKKAELNTLITLSVNEKAVFSEDGLSLELSEITDSRCPVNVHCVWAGNTKVKLSVTDINKENSAIELCLGECDKGFQEADSIIIQQNNQSYRLLLNKVDPYPGTASGRKTATLLLKKN